MPQLQLLLQHIYIKMQTVSSLFGGKCADLLKQDEWILSIRNWSLFIQSTWSLCPSVGSWSIRCVPIAQTEVHSLRDLPSDLSCILATFLRTYWLTWCFMLRIEVIMANTERTRSIALQSLAAAARGSPSTQSNPISIQQLVFKCSSEAGCHGHPPSSSSLQTDL